MVSIRPTTREDYSSIIDILKRTDHFTAEEIDIADELLNSYFNLSAESGYWTFTAVDERVVGYVCYGPTPLTVGTYDIYWIAVDPEVQGRRIGTELLTFAEWQFVDGGGQPALPASAPHRTVLGLQIVCIHAAAACVLARERALGLGALIVREVLGEGIGGVKRQSVLETMMNFELPGIVIHGSADGAIVDYTPIRIRPRA